MRSTSRPFLKTSKSGMLRALKREADAGFSSTFSLPIRTRPFSSEASCSSTGVSIRQGPHHGAHMSTRIGRVDDSTSVLKFESVIVTGCPLAGRSALQLPQTA